jgi:hypothetical protein
MYSPQTNTKRRPAVKRAAFLLDRERRKKQQEQKQIMIFLPSPVFCRETEKRQRICEAGQRQRHTLLLP